MNADPNKLFADGMEALNQGRFKDACDALTNVLKAVPGNPHVMGALGFALANIGEVEKALEYTEKAARLAPAEPQNLMNLAFAQDKAGQKEAALTTLNKACRLVPNNPAILLQTGRLLAETGKFQEALLPLKELYKVQPDLGRHPLRIVLEKLAAGGRDREDWQQALGFCREVEEMFPDDIEAKRAVALCLMMEEDYGEALLLAKDIYALDPDNINVLYSMGFILFNLNRHEECLPFIERFLEVHPNHVDALLVKGQTLFFFNELDAAGKIFERVLELSPGHKMGFLQLAKTRSPKPGEEIFEGLEELDRETGDDDPFKPMMGYTFGEIYERAGDYDKAFEHFTKANRIAGAVYAKRGYPFDEEKIEADFARLRTFYSKQNLDSLKGVGSDSERPIFIVAMPRSGTTLLEQVISNHSDVFGGGELSYATSIAVMLYGELEKDDPEKVRAVLEEKAREYSQLYLANLPGDTAKHRFVTDKMPYNFKQLGLLQTILPKAKFIHIKRNPLDICLSMYKGFFNKGFTYAHDLKNLGYYYRKYYELMDYWRSVLPQPLFEVQYEDFVANPEEIGPKILEHCGLDWQPQCLEFYKKKSKVVTMSTQQVRQPIHAKSVEKWRRYEKYIEPLLEGLGEDIVSTLKI